ncbi:hypothetical protein N2W54_000505 [Lotmaria passim]
MPRHASWRRVLDRLCLKGSSPFILSVGSGPPGMTPPATATVPDSVLPVYIANFYDMSDFEKDYVVRWYEYLRSNGESKPSLACRAVLQMHSAPQRRATEAALTETSWKPFFDVVLLPDGSVCFGWFRHHPFDCVWTRHVATYIADLWEKAPASLWELHQERLYGVTLTHLPQRQRQQPLFQPAARLTSADVMKGYERAAQAVHFAARRLLPLEDRVLLLCCGKQVTLTAVQELMKQVATQKSELSAGSATAVLRMLISAYALHRDSRNASLVEDLRTAANRVCDLARDSRVHLCLTWAAALLGGSVTSSKANAAASTFPVTGAAALEPRNAPPEALLAAMLSALHPSAAHRGAILRSHVEDYAAPLYATLASEEATLIDVLEPVIKAESQPDSVATAAAASAAAASATASLGPHRPSDTPDGVVDRLDNSYFTSVLKKEEERAGDQQTTSSSPSSCGSSADGLCAWLPGTGMDVHGCWCIALTHTALLASQLGLHRHYFRDEGVAALVKTAETTNHVLRVTLTRRCSYTTTQANMWSQYSILTHLASVTLQPAVSVILLHLTSAVTGDAAAAAWDAVDKTSLLALLFLFPALELHSFYGGTTSLFRGALSSGSLAFPCYLESNLDAHAEVVRVPAEFVTLLSTRLENRETAVVCIVQSGLAVKDVFLLEELSSHLRHIVLA